MVTFWWFIKLKSHTLQHQNSQFIVLFVCFSHAIGMLLERNSMHIEVQQACFWRETSNKFDG